MHFKSVVDVALI